MYCLTVNIDSVLSDSSDTSQDDSTYNDKNSGSKGANGSGGSKKPSTSEAKPVPEPSSKSAETKSVTDPPSNGNGLDQKQAKLSSNLPGPGAGLDSQLMGGNTLEDPIDVDAYSSLYEPTATHDYVRLSSFVLYYALTYRYLSIARQGGGFLRLRPLSSTYQM